MISRHEQGLKAVQFYWETAMKAWPGREKAEGAVGGQPERRRVATEGSTYPTAAREESQKSFLEEPVPTRGAHWAPLILGEERVVL